jgi:hypothetical protein
MGFPPLAIKTALTHIRMDKLQWRILQCMVRSHSSCCKEMFPCPCATVPLFAFSVRDDQPLTLHFRRSFAAQFGLYHSWLRERSGECVCNTFHRLLPPVPRPSDARLISVHTFCFFLFMDVIVDVLESIALSDPRTFDEGKFLVIVRLSTLISRAHHHQPNTLLPSDVGPPP